MSIFSDLAGYYNDDVNKEVNAPIVTKTGTYTMQVIEVNPGVMYDEETPKLNLTVQLFNEDLEKVGRAWFDITPAELRNQRGKVVKASELFYRLYKLTGAQDIEDFVEQLNGFTFTGYGIENYGGRKFEFPLELQDDEVEDENYQRVFVDEDEDAKRELLLDAGLKSRLMVIRVGAHRG